MTRPEPGYWLDAALTLVVILALGAWLYLLGIWRQP